MRIALDTNVLVYRAGVDRAPNDAAKIVEARALVATIVAAGDVALVAPTQAIGELYVVLRRAGASATDARELVERTAAAFETPPSRIDDALAAAALAAEHKLQFWDALILSVAARAGCSLLLSEDMQHGFRVRGLTIVNPFARPIHPELKALLRP